VIDERYHKKRKWKEKEPTKSNSRKEEHQGIRRDGQRHKRRIENGTEKKSESSAEHAGKKGSGGVTCGSVTTATSAVDEREAILVTPRILHPMPCLC